MKVYEIYLEVDEPGDVELKQINKSVELYIEQCGLIFKNYWDFKTFIYTLNEKLTKLEEKNIQRGLIEKI